MRMAVSYYQCGRCSYDVSVVSVYGRAVVVPSGSTTYELKVPWAQIARVFLNCDGLAFNSAYLRKYANRSDDDLNGEKLGAWKEKIAEIMKKIRSELA